MKPSVRDAPPGGNTNLVGIALAVVAEVLRTRVPSSGCIHPSQALLFPQGADAALPLGRPGKGKKKHTGQPGGPTTQFWDNYISERLKKKKTTKSPTAPDVII